MHMYLIYIFMFVVHFSTRVVNISDNLRNYHLSHYMQQALPKSRVTNFAEK